MLLCGDGVQEPVPDDECPLPSAMYLSLFYLSFPSQAPSREDAWAAASRHPVSRNGMARSGEFDSGINAGRMWTCIRTFFSQAAANKHVDLDAKNH